MKVRYNGLIQLLQEILLYRPIGIKLRLPNLISLGMIYFCNKFRCVYVNITERQVVIKTFFLLSLFLSLGLFIKWAVPASTSEGTCLVWAVISDILSEWFARCRLPFWVMMATPCLASDGSTESKRLRSGLAPSYCAASPFELARPHVSQELSRYFWGLGWGNICLTSFTTVMWIWVFCLDIK